MIDEVYFFDSYAIFELIFGNKDYEKYKGVKIISTKLNLFEVFYHLLKKKGKEEANFFLDNYDGVIIEYGPGTIKHAAELKLLNKKLSMADCIGYISSLYTSVKFLTGDKEFEGMKNVEFVK